MQTARHGHAVVAALVDASEEKGGVELMSKSVYPTAG